MEVFERGLLILRAEQKKNRNGHWAEEVELLDIVMRAAMRIDHAVDQELLELARKFKTLV